MAIGILLLIFLVGGALYSQGFLKLDLPIVQPAVQASPTPTVQASPTPTVQASPTPTATTQHK